MQSIARVVELADTLDSGSSGRKVVGVQVPPRAHKGVFMIYLLRLVRLFLVIAVFCFTAGILSIIALYLIFSRDLPKLDGLKDYRPPVASEVFSSDGTKIAEFWTEKRYLLSQQEMPKVIIQAIVASEDDRFFEHKGIDYQGIFRAFIENLKAGHLVQGGSTITQQVVKSLLLTREKTFSRKIKEAILATRIERHFNKDEIINLYLNQTFFGNRAYGVEAAAQNYFHKSAKELSIAEAAMIAGLAKAPSSTSPLHDPTAAKNRQEYVIQRMYEVGYITKDQLKEANAYPLKIYESETDKDFNNHYAPWFTEYIRRTLQEKYGDQAPYTRGFRIDTTVDLSMQKAADAAVDRGVRELDKRQGYSGPVRKISPDALSKFADESHLKIIDEESEGMAKDILHQSTPDEILKQPTPLHANKYYEAVITNVDSAKQELGVRVGHVNGLIKMADYGWARKRDTNSQGYDGGIYIRDPKGTFSVGDVLQVKLKEAADLDPKKGYVLGSTYFTLEQNPEVESALFSYEPETGFVRAIVGGKDFRQSEYNRAMQALRQTGSSIKPSIYSAALDKGYTPNSIIEDSPIYYEVTPGRFWSPQNYGGGFKGPTSFRSGLVNSRNVVTVRILMDIGCDYVTAYMRKLGITTPIQRYYSMALGSNDMKLYELSRAYGTFATGGILPELVTIKRMTDRDGNVLEEYHPRQIVSFTDQLASQNNKGKSSKANGGYNQELMDAGQKWIDSDHLKLTDAEKKILYGDYIPEGYTISPRTAYTMVQLMNDVVNYGTGFKVKELKRPAAGKTGTTNDETDTWFVGFVPDNLFAGVWVGFDAIKKIGAKETGGHTAAPIFLYYMQQVLKDRPVAQFVIPKGIEAAALKAPMDNDSEGDAESGGIANPDGGSGGADFFIHDF